MQITRHILGALVCLTLVACSDETTTGPEPATSITRSNIYADSANGWVYYSIDGDSIVPPSQATTTAWDIKMAYLPGAATRKIDVLLNSGTVGPGTVTGAVVASRYENLTTAPSASSLTVDDTASASRIIPSNVVGADIVFVYDVTKHTISPSPDKVIVIKTGKGQMVKFQFTSIYKDAVTNPDIYTPMGYYHFRYAKANNGKW